MIPTLGKAIPVNSKQKQPAKQLVRLGLGVRFKLVLWAALPLLIILIIANIVDWRISRQIIETIQNAPGTDIDSRDRAIELVELARLTIAISSTLILGLALFALPLWFREIHHPLEQVTTAAVRISNGDLDTPVPHAGAELNDLAQTLENTRLRLRATLAEAARQAKMEAELRAETRHNNELSILLALSQLLLTTVNEDAILNLVVETVRELFSADASAIVLPAEKTGALTLRAMSGWPSAASGGKLGRNTESQTDYALKQGRPVAVDDYRAPLPFKIDFDPNVLSGLSVPMTHEDQVVGALLAYSREPGHFDPEAARLLSLVANQAAAALERSRLYAQSVLQANELRTLARIGEALNRAETADITLRLVLTESLKLVNNDQGCLILLEPDNYTLRLYTWLGIPDIVVQRFNERRFQKYHGVFARSILRGELVELTEPMSGIDSAFEYADTLLAQKVNVPLKTEDKTIGVIALNGLPTDDRARRMLLALADLAATAIAKTRLFERTQMLAISDELTGLYNRRGFTELGQREFERARRFNRYLAAIMFDIDHFKNVINTYGQAAGNVVLTGLADLCRREMREVDVIGRYGSEVFGILLPETALEGVYQAAERLRQAAATTLYNAGRVQLKITISAGVATLDETDDSLAKLIDRADQARQTAKRTGRDRVCVWATGQTDH